MKTENPRGRLVIPEGARLDSVDLKIADRERRERPSGFESLGLGMRTELKFDPDLYCPKCERPLTKTGPSAFRFACPCWNGREEVEGDGDVEESEEKMSSL